MFVIGRETRQIYLILITLLLSAEKFQFHNLTVWKPCDKQYKKKAHFFWCLFPFISPHLCLSITAFVSNPHCLQLLFFCLFVFCFILEFCSEASIFISGGNKLKINFTHMNISYNYILLYHFFPCILFMTLNFLDLKVYLWQLPSLLSAYKCSCNVCVISSRFSLSVYAN